MNVKPVVLAAIIAAALFNSARALSSEFGVSVYARPGSYGVIDVRDLPPPRVIYEQPVVVHPQPDTRRQPVYVHVPPGHAKHWSKHCRKYNACDRPVYFVDDRWYDEVYAGRQGIKNKGDKHNKHKDPKHPKHGDG